MPYDVQKELTLNPQAVAKFLDQEETKQKNQDLHDELGWMTRLISSVKLSGRVGFFLISAVSLYGFYLQYKAMNPEDGNMTPAKLALLINAVLSTGFFTSAHTGAGVLDKSKAAVVTGVGKFACNLFQKYCCTPESEEVQELRKEVQQLKSQLATIQTWKA